MISEQRDLTQVVFNTRQFVWYNPNIQDLTTTIIITQNENGPCALIALLNCMILTRQFTKHETLYDDAINLEIDKLILLLEKNKKISLLLLNQIIASLILSASSNKRFASQDVSSILDLLPKLYYGLNINPNFVTGTICNGISTMEFSDEAILKIMDPGNPANLETLNNSSSAENDASKDIPQVNYSPEYLLFKILRIPVYHGWVLPKSDESNIQTRLLSYLKDFDSCQNFVIYVDEILSNDNKDDESQPTNETKNILRLASELVCSWLDQTSIQFTNEGLKNLWSNNTNAANFAVFFRNDHFSTIYKHEGQTYALVTDEGFSNLNIFWQELNSFTGDEKFYDSFFTEVTNDNFTKFQDPTNGNLSTEKSDLLLAKQLQEEEDKKEAERLKKEKKAKEKKVIC